MHQQEAKNTAIDNAGLIFYNFEKTVFLKIQLAKIIVFDYYCKEIVWSFFYTYLLLEIRI